MLIFEILLLLLIKKRRGKKPHLNPSLASFPMCQQYLLLPRRPFLDRRFAFRKRWALCHISTGSSHVWVNSFNCQQEDLRSILGITWPGDVPNSSIPWSPYLYQHFQDVRALWQVSVLPFLWKRAGPWWVAGHEPWGKAVAGQGMKHVLAFAA